jgi:DNA gyrase subunit A
MGSRNARGTPLVQLLPIPREERITSLVAVSEFSDDEYLLMLTKQGYIKKTALSAFGNIRSNGLIAISLIEEDELRWVRLVRQEDSILIGSRKGMTIHFKASHEHLRPLGRATRGVKSMNLRSGDSIISMDVLSSQITAQMLEAAELEEVDTDLEGEEETPIQTEGPWVLVVTTKGLGKRVPVAQFRLQKRAGLGLRALKFRYAEDELAALWVVHTAQELMVITQRGIIIRQAADDIAQQSRSATGVRVQRLDEDDAIAAVALVPMVSEMGGLDTTTPVESLSTTPTPYDTTSENGENGDSLAEELEEG